MKTTMIVMGAVVAAMALLSSCASHSDGRRMTLAERWRAMVERQDAAARAFVDTGMDPADSRRAAPSGMETRSAPASAQW